MHHVGGDESRKTSDAQDYTDINEGEPKHDGDFGNPSAELVDSAD